jgi:hypothetical protein
LAGNILVNPGFESGSLSPWFNSSDFCGGCTWSVTSAEAHSGIYSAVVSGNRLLVQDFTPIPTSHVTDASVWLMMPDTGVAFIAFEYSNGTEGGQQFHVGSTWSQFNVTSLLTPGLDLEGFGVYGCSGCPGSSITYADDFVLDTTTPTPEPASFLLFGTTLLSLVPFRRKLFGR